MENTAFTQLSHQEELEINGGYGPVIVWGARAILTYVALPLIGAAADTLVDSYKSGVADGKKAPGK